MQLRSWHDFVQVNDEGRITGITYYDWESELGVSHSAPGGETESHANGPTYNGSLAAEDNGDLIAVNLTAGQTYTWSYRGTGDHGIADPWLQLIGTNGTTVITEDDDGGLGRTSQITYTATANGTYYLKATSWYQIDPTAPDYQDDGDYTIVQWSPQAGHDAGGTIATAGTISVGTNYNYLEAAGDVDVYAITLTAGMYYTFTYNGGVASEPVDPGESIGVLGLQNAAGGTVVGLSVSTAGETGIGYFATTSGTYYLSAQAYSNFIGGTPQTGGYTIDVSAVDPSTRDPLESLNWDSANNVVPKEGDGNVIYIYFAPAGVNLTTETNAGWQQNEIDAVMHALQTVYEPLTGFDYVITNDIDQATFKMMTVTTASYGARFFPQDPAYGDLQGIGSFNLASGGFRGFPQSLEPGGFSYAVILHEFGHAHGIAHPHDTGGGSEIMLGVTASTGSLGVYNLNQGVYTVMSYNDAWRLHPDGPSAFTVAGIDNGWSRTLGAFDVAVMQARYGLQATNEGDTVYQLTDVADDAYYQTIVDTGGIDAISYGGALDAQIDLTAATLDYTPTGGGAISFLYNAQPLPAAPGSFLVRGGYTIANGVVIENATGGNGNDVLIGNAADNVLNGGGGSDTAVYTLATGPVTINLATDSATGGGGTDTLTSIESAVGSKYDDSLTGDDGNNTLDGGDGDDAMSAGLGSDTASYSSVSGGVTVDLRIDGVAQDTGGGGIDTLSGFENLTGSSFDDNLTGTDDANVINGGAGNDVMDGLGGIDTASYANAASGVTASLATGTSSGGAGNDTLVGFENLTGSNHGDTLTGDVSANIIRAGHGNDVVDGGDGDDLLDGGTGTDRVTYASAAAAVFVNLSIAGAQATGGAGADTLVSIENLTGSGFADTLTGNAGANDIIGLGGNDTINAGDGNDVVEGGDDDDNLSGGGGTDTASYANAGAAVTVSLAAIGGQATGGAGTDTLTLFENLTGSAHNDTLTGTATANTINGGAGNDVIYAGDGNDIVNGGDGDDTVNGEGGNDTVNAGAGNDTVSGGDGTDTLNGDAGNDTVNAGAGNDTVNGGDGNDTVNGEAGNDTLNGGAGNDTLNGGDGNDTLSGGAGNDRIIGGLGVDTVTSGDGVDVATLGDGDDFFIAQFSAKDTALKTGTMAVDIITDFDAAGNDVIDVSGLGLTFKGTNANKSAGDLTYKSYTSVNGAENALGFDIDGQPGASGVSGPVTVVYGNSDGGKPDFAIILLNTSSVDASDFTGLSVSSLMAASGGAGGGSDYFMV